MSTEQDKDSFSLKRNRGGEGGLDILGSPGLLLGSPEKKRRKSSAQVPPFSPLSEYAPPPNPSADHLIASNPFDDGYSSPSLKPLPPAGPYYVHSHYPGHSGYAPPRTPGAPFLPRNQPHPFSQHPAGHNRFIYGDNPNRGQPFSSSVARFRAGPGEHVGRNDLSPEGTPGSPGRPRQRSGVKQDPGGAASKNCEEHKARDGEAKSGAEKLNGVLHADGEASKKSPRPADARRANNAASRRSASSSSEPVYPCGVCLSEVNDDQEAILCEASCQKWFHRVCTGMTETAYNLLTAETSAVWGCDSCMEDRGAPLLKTRDASDDHERD
ncbi:pygopus homolog 1 [Puntigrus tetrazona]|uniref:pygopus homolog 1 n=1 Tax=Puntigrus tetrazona TaxID=1606681 RepID=UPI001C8A2363|nr:pygopus homolog 1 [Puntigrus tetrazona]